MRVVALNSLDDLDAALPALRVFAGDEDAGVAVSAIRAIKFLKDTGSIEVLTAMAEDAGRPAVLRAHAVRALVDMGGEISAEVVASILPLLPPDDSTTKTYVSTSVAVMRK
ncbi:MAG: HEAT repeat domain-containing protein, partial [Planctomycetota bacterium]